MNLVFLLLRFDWFDAFNIVTNIGILSERTLSTYIYVKVREIASFTLIKNLFTVHAS